MVTYDGTLERNVVSLDGTDGYALMELEQHYARLQDGFTIETYLYVSAAPTKTTGIFANMQSGGFGLQMNSSGHIQLLAYTGNKAYERASAALPLGQWVHVVGVYTGSKIQLYLNGVLANEVTASKTSFALPPRGSYYLSVGGDSDPAAYYGVNFISGKMAIANLYSDAMTATEVAALYQQLD